MKRWCITKLGDYENEGTRVPKLNLYPCNSRIWSKPNFAWAIGQVAIADLTAISQDPEIYILPDATLDAAWSSLPSNVRNVVKNRVEQAGLSFSVQTNWTVRQVLVYLVQQIQPAIGSVEQGDVKDIEA